LELESCGMRTGSEKPAHDGRDDDQGRLRILFDSEGGSLLPWGI